MRSRLLFLVIGLAAGVALTSGVVWAKGFRTHISTDGSWYSTWVADTQPSKSYTYAAARICKEGPADVKITGVRIAESFSDIEVVDFSVAPSLDVGQQLPGTIKDYLEFAGKTSMTGPPTKTLETRCTPERDDLRDVIVEMRVPSETALPAVAIGFVIDYAVRGRDRTLTTNTGFTFCHGDETDQQVVELVEERPDDAISACDYS